MRVPNPWIVVLVVPSAIAKNPCLNLQFVDSPLQTHENDWLEIWNMLEKLLEIPDHLGLGAFMPTISPISMCSTKAHCKQHDSPLHSLLKRISGMLRGNFQSAHHSNLWCHIFTLIDTHANIQQTNNQTNRVGGRQSENQSNLTDQNYYIDSNVSNKLGRQCTCNDSGSLPKPILHQRGERVSISTSNLWAIRLCEPRCKHVARTSAYWSLWLRQLQHQTSNAQNHMYVGSTKEKRQVLVWHLDMGSSKPETILSVVLVILVILAKVKSCQNVSKWVPWVPLSPGKMRFPTEKCNFLPKNALSCRKMHFPAEKCTFLQKNAAFSGHMAGNRRKLQEGFRAQESRTLANFHKNYYACFKGSF